MGPDLTGGRCPSCGAAVRPDAAWCGQCYADFRPAPAPEPAPAPVPVAAPAVAAGAAYGAPAGDPLTQPLLDFLPGQPVAPPDESAPAQAAAAEKTWPCTRCGSPNPLLASTCSVCGTPFLAELGGDARKLLVLPLVGDLGSMSRGKRLAVALGAVAALLVPLALITLLLTGSPPADAPASDSQVVSVPPQP